MCARTTIMCLVLPVVLVAQQTLQTKHVAAIHTTWDATSPVLARLPVGATVTATSHRSGYSHIRTAGDTTGWVYSRYLVPAESTSHVVPLPIDTIAALPKSQPVEAQLATCPDTGASHTRLDAETNLLKNRVDEGGTYAHVSFASVLALPWQNMPTRRYLWDADDRTRTAAYEGAAIRFAGYIVDVRREGAEATNCGESDSTWADWHMWIVEKKEDAVAGRKSDAIVVEVTPRVRMKFPGRFAMPELRKLRDAHRQVAVSGWLMLDPDHPNNAVANDSHPASRGTIWEIHPVLDVVPLDIP